jgi:uncharacterized protein (DUF488 family)
MLYYRRKILLALLEIFDGQLTAKRLQKYDILFNTYETTVLKSNDEAIKFIANLLKNNKRVALTCFEKNPMQCHRSRVAKQLMNVEKQRLYIN